MLPKNKNWFQENAQKKTYRWIISQRSFFRTITKWHRALPWPLCNYPLLSYISHKEIKKQLKRLRAEQPGETDQSKA